MGDAQVKTLIKLLLLVMTGIASAGSAFFVREVETGGMTKQCVYDYLGSEYIITISSVKICPLTIPVN
jgi:hypothetical protein